MYINCHSYYSLKYGTDSPESLVEQAAEMGITQLALTDINNTSGVSKFVTACEKHHIKPVLGIEFHHNHQCRFIGIARNNAGWEELCRLLSHYSLNKENIPAIAPPLKDVYIIYKKSPLPISELRTYEFVGISTDQLHALYSSGLLPYRNKLIACNTITFANKKDYHTHRILRCIDLNIMVSQLTEPHCSSGSSYMRTPREITQHFETYPDILERADRLLNACTFTLEMGMHNNRQCFTVDKNSDMKLLRKLAVSGCSRRYPEGQHKTRPRLEKELRVIEKMDFAAYFLITWDIVRYAHAAGFHHVGRGSGANSLVAYCIGLTDVDPLELDLYFELSLIHI